MSRDFDTMPPLTKRDYCIALAIVALALGGPTAGWVVIIWVVRMLT